VPLAAVLSSVVDAELGLSVCVVAQLHVERALAPAVFREQVCMKSAAAVVQSA